tara:strand:- start:1008 stop:1196 length:189 start_codon:yes stop_codon:yes gene_type:complete
MNIVNKIIVFDFEMNIFREYWEYTKKRKKFWILPIVIFLMIFGFILIISEGSVVAPFIYTIF